MQYKHAIFFDIDHTLYNPNTKTIPASTLEALRKLHARNDTLIAIATGRAFYMLDIIRELRPFIDAYITINGQVIYVHDELIHDAPMDKDLIAKSKALFQNENLTYGFIGEKTQAVNRMNTYVEAMFINQNIPLPIVNADYDQHHKVYQMWAFADDTTLTHIESQIDVDCIVPWISDGFDIIAPQKNKYHGVKRLIEHLNIPLSSTVCFGDGANDKEMLAAIPNSFAMANADDSVKQHAKYIAKAYDEDGIYDALRWLKLID